MLLIKKPRSFGLHVSYLMGMVLTLIAVRARLEAEGDISGSASSG